MESSMDYGTGIKLIIFYVGEDPMELVPDGWVVINREEPSEYKGLINPGILNCEAPEETGP